MHKRWWKWCKAFVFNAQRIANANSKDIRFVPKCLNHFAHSFVICCEIRDGTVLSQEFQFLIVNNNMAIFKHIMRTQLRFQDKKYKHNVGRCKCNYEPPTVPTLHLAFAIKANKNQQITHLQNLQDYIHYLIYKKIHPNRVTLWHWTYW